MLFFACVFIKRCQKTQPKRNKSAKTILFDVVCSLGRSFRPVAKNACVHDKRNSIIHTAYQSLIAVPYKTIIIGLDFDTQNLTVVDKCLIVLGFVLIRLNDAA